jgi:hypothetical protein
VELVRGAGGSFSVVVPGWGYRAPRSGFGKCQKSAKLLIKSPAGDIEHPGPGFGKCQKSAKLLIKSPAGWILRVGHRGFGPGTGLVLRCGFDAGTRPSNSARRWSMASWMEIAGLSRFVAVMVRNYHGLLNRASHLRKGNAGHRREVTLVG